MNLASVNKLISFRMISLQNQSEFWLVLGEIAFIDKRIEPFAFGL